MRIWRRLGFITIVLFSTTSLILSIYIFFNAMFVKMVPTAKTEIYYSGISLQIAILETVVLLVAVLLAVMTVYGFGNIEKSAVDAAIKAAKKTTSAYLKTQEDKSSRGNQTGGQEAEDRDTSLTHVGDTKPEDETS